MNKNNNISNAFISVVTAACLLYFLDKDSTVNGQIS